MKPRIKLKLKSNVLQMHPQRPWPLLVEYLENRLQQAKDGEILGVFEVVKWRGDTIGSGWCSTHVDRRIIGGLEELKTELVHKLK